MLTRLQRMTGRAFGPVRKSSHRCNSSYSFEEDVPRYVPPGRRGQNVQEHESRPRSYGRGETDSKPRSARRSKGRLCRQLDVNFQPPLIVEYSNHDLPMPFPRIGIPAPKPSDQYLTGAMEEPKRLDLPSSSHLLILDLNGTLLYRDKSDPHRGSTKPYPRPHLKEFINYVLANFKVMIWSSATPVNVQAMINDCFTHEQREQLVAVWSRDTLGLTPMEYKKKVKTFKLLPKVWRYPSFQGQVGPWSQKTTILLDDSFIKAQAQPYNHVEVPEYNAQRLQEGNDTVLRQVAGYLEELRYQENVSAFIRTKKFEVGQGWANDVLFMDNDLSAP
ncbi:putative FCP1 y domain-containing protein [Neolecta irregularis DAH-3]|uniref:Mitochondrial import inner membrane translocase subunit TIM50 n=1 Tax=Neolecta irregularis (strain DAH-3) TaxID=1198029 RepID=A0A1U7LXB0_NEOID|nr:putative FCP1 y domain-containing protein [Neolecta irregularis DAH-3]|eukprot:OLL27161.1 putative FCP1 y domain-containing protein [Neolecta irregularis DAH-3]